MAEQTKKHKIHIKKGDTVVVISGKDKGRKGKVRSVEPKTGRVFVEKVNIVKRHTRPTKAAPQGGIVKQEAAIDCSNVMIYCSRCGRPVRIGKDLQASGERLRKCVRCGDLFDK